MSPALAGGSLPLALPEYSRPKSIRIIKKKKELLAHLTVKSSFPYLALGLSILKNFNLLRLQKLFMAGKEHLLRDPKFSSAQSLSCVRLRDPTDCSMPSFPVHNRLPDLAQTHVHWAGDAIQPSHPYLILIPFSYEDLIVIHWSRIYI